MKHIMYKIRVKAIDFMRGKKIIVKKFHNKKQPFRNIMVS